MKLFPCLAIAAVNLALSIVPAQAGEPLAGGGHDAAGAPAESVKLQQPPPNQLKSRAIPGAGASEVGTFKKKKDKDWDEAVGDLKKKKDYDWDEAIEEKGKAWLPPVPVPPGNSQEVPTTPENSVEHLNFKVTNSHEKKAIADPAGTAGVKKPGATFDRWGAYSEGAPASPKTDVKRGPTDASDAAIAKYNSEHAGDRPGSGPDSINAVRSFNPGMPGPALKSPIMQMPPGIGGAMGPGAMGPGAMGGR